MAMRGLLLLLLSLLVSCVESQFQLSFGTPTPPVPSTPRPTLPGGYDPACRDTIGNCGSYGASACQGVYQSWAKKNCEATCGFCKPLPTQPPPCVDALSNCAEFQQETCSDPKYGTWASQNCRRFCRLCTASQLSQIDARTTQPTTVPPASCVDKVDCTLYGRDACSVDSYGNWGRENCPLYCGFCQGVATPPPLCVDKSPDCALYQSDMCTNPSYSGFVEGNCRKFCGRCSGSFGSRGKRQAAPDAPPPPSTPPKAPAAPSKGPGRPMVAATTQGTFPTPPKPTTPPVRPSAGQTDAPTATPSAVPVNTNGPTMAPSEDCLNRIDDCRLYGAKSCSGIYEPWAKFNCPRFCGFCIHPNDTKEMECKDNLPNCNEYQSDTCTNVKYRIFAEDNCRKSCNLCDSDIRAGNQMSGADQAPQLVNKQSVTTGPSQNSTECKDTVDYCWTEPDENCFGIYEPWAQGHCPFRCGFCPEKPKCEDKLTYCSQYDMSACTATSFIGWARENCRKTCNLCKLPVRPTSDAPPAGQGAGSTTDATGTKNTYPPSPGGTGSPPGFSTTNGPVSMVPSSSTFVNVTKPDGSIATGITNTYIIQGPPSVVPGTCLYNGDSHLQDRNWYDGCDYVCNCLDAKSNRMICTDRCTRWQSEVQVSGCSWVKEEGFCCKRLECTSS